MYSDWSSFIDAVLNRIKLFNDSRTTVFTDDELWNVYQSWCHDHQLKGFKNPHVKTGHGDAMIAGVGGKSALAAKVWQSALYTILQRPRDEVSDAKVRLQAILHRIADGGKYYHDNLVSVRNYEYPRF